MASPDPTVPDGFSELGLCTELLDALAELGYEEPTPIQAQALPPLLAGRDLLGQAATGTGKTAAFALPVLHSLAGRPERTRPMALVLVPTRELAMQVSEAMHRYGRRLGARVLPIYGGQPIGRQLGALHRGVDVVVATPGRAIDHIGRGTLVLDDVEMVVLDEADEMLDMGFAEDLEAILERTPTTRQTLLFSATMPARIDKLARSHLQDPVRIELGREAATADVDPLVRQVAYMVPRSHKPAALGRILDAEAPEAAIVFCRTRNEVDELVQTLNGRGYTAEALHGGMGQEQRDRAMGRLKRKTADLLIATDVAARGLDIDHLSHVVNYDVPSAPEAYVHRIGRVGRAGREGVAITLAEPREHRLLKNIERVTGRKLPIEKLPTVADMRTRRMELLQATLREIALAGDLDHYRVVVDSLSDEFDVVEVALAAVKMAYEAEGIGTDESEIPDVAPKPERAGRPKGKDRGAPPGSKGLRPKGTGEAMTRLYVSVGRGAGVRPQDLVGAIAGESGLAGRQIGSIEIDDRFSLVEVPAGEVDRVLQAMKGATIRGKRVTVRRERFDRSDRSQR